MLLKNYDEINYYMRYMKLSNLVLFFIFVLAFILRFWNLEAVPEWHWDEGVNMNISWNLVNGRLLWFSLFYVFVPHPPLFFIILGILLKIFGNDILVLRALSALFGIFTGIVLYFIGKEIIDRNSGILAFFLFAIYPHAIYWNRRGIGNNQLMFLSVLAVYFFIRYVKDKKERFLYLSSLAIALSMVTEYIGIALFFSIILLFWLYDKRDLIKVIVLSSSIFMIFLASMLILFPEEFLHDLFFQFQRFKFTSLNFFPLIFSLILLLIFYRFRNEIIRIFMNFIQNLAYLLNIKEPTEVLKENLFLSLIFINLFLATTLLRPLSDEILFKGIDYFWFGILGFFLVDRRYSRILLLFFSPLFFLILKIGRTDHMLIPLCPFFTLGLAFLLLRLYRFFSRKRIISLVVLILLFYPFAFLLYYDFISFVLEKNLNVEDIENRYKVVEFINNHVDNSDLIIADSHFSRFIKCKTSVLLQAVAIEGKGIAYMAPDYGRERFRFNCSYRNARFIIIDSEGIEWMKENAMDNEKLNEIYEEMVDWSLTLIDGYRIYRNPALD